MQLLRSFPWVNKDVGIVGASSQVAILLCGSDLAGEGGTFTFGCWVEPAAYWGPDMHMGRTAVFPSGSTMGRFSIKLGIS